MNGTCLTRQQYRFTYDYGNRLLTANHFTHNGTSWTNTNNYSESGIAYDLNGNIKSYTRRGLTTAPNTFGIIDQLTYTYGDAARPDRLTNVSDAGNATKGFKFTSGAAAYTYDLNGNMTQDNHKSLSISYNYLNLPSYVSNTGGSDITLTYTADGEKLSKVSSAGTRSYVSGIEYLGTGLDAIYHGEGRCTPNGATAFFYEYTIKDHLGNARVNFRANGAAVTFLQELHYYPFGMLMEGLGAAQVTNNGYKYNGKELNEDLGLNWSDYGARWYDAALGRWWSVDPMGEKTMNFSTYAYVHNNPMLLIDPNGMLAGNPFDIMAERSEKMGERRDERERQIAENEAEAKRGEVEAPIGKLNIEEAGIEEQGSPSFQEVAEIFNDANPGLNASLATTYDWALEEKGGPIGYTDLAAYDADVPHLNNFAKAVQKNQSGVGTIKIWIDSYNYQRSPRIKSYKNVPQVLIDESRRSGIALNTGIINAYNQAHDALKRNGINIGAGKGGIRVEVWIKPLTIGQASKGKRTEHSNTILWISGKA